MDEMLRGILCLVYPHLLHSHVNMMDKESTPHRPDTFRKFNGGWLFGWPKMDS